MTKSLIIRRKSTVGDHVQIDLLQTEVNNYDLQFIYYFFYTYIVTVTAVWQLL